MFRIAVVLFELVLVKYISNDDCTHEIRSIRNAAKPKSQVRRPKQFGSKQMNNAADQLSLLGLAAFAAPPSGPSLIYHAALQP